MAVARTRQMVPTDDKKTAWAVRPRPSGWQGDIVVARQSKTADTVAMGRLSNRMFVSIRKCDWGM
jgi:hypothetical protein